MHDQEKSDSAIVAGKPPNKTGSPVAEAAEPRAGTKGTADQQSTLRTQSRDRVNQALGRVRQAAGLTSASPSTPEVGAGCSNRARPDLCGGCSAMSIPTANLDPEATLDRSATKPFNHIADVRVCDPDTLPARGWREFTDADLRGRMVACIEDTDTVERNAEPNSCQMGKIW